VLATTHEQEHPLERVGSLDGFLVPFSDFVENIVALSGIEEV
jgi:hypothetical protein